MVEEDLFDLNYYDDNSENKIINDEEELSNISKSKDIIIESQFQKKIEMVNSRHLDSNVVFDEHNQLSIEDKSNNDKDSINDHPFNSNEKFAIEDDIDIKEFKTINKYAIEYPFELDDFQKRSIIRLEQHKNVLVCAHTSSGKTVIAEYGIALGKRNQRRVLYTSPIKALSNQKYREFKKKFGDVGILTGDVFLNPVAQCIVMTTEILQNSLYKNSELLNAVEWVVFDEIHYINDTERGHVWEEILILLPPQIGIIMLSATIPNYMEFAQWVGRIKNTTIFVQNTLKRIVPLEHKLYVDSSSIFLVKDSNNKVYDDNVKKALEAVHRNKSKQIEEQDQDKEVNEGKQVLIGKQKCNRSDYIKKTNMIEKIEEIVNYLHTNCLTPAVIFIFSIKQITEYSMLLSKIQLVNKNESKKIDWFFEMCIGTLSEEDRKIAQIQEIKEMLSSGMAIHHSGLLPILKEIIEILYSKGLIKILLATTSFSIGLNMPTRTVAFTDIYKYNNEKKEILSSSEYLQMCGRAGRRGIDTIGNVFLLLTEKHKTKKEKELINMLNGTGTEVESKFRLSYRTIISFFSRSIKSINEFFKESFLENVNIEQIPSLMKEISDLSKEIKLKDNINCDYLNDNSLINDYVSIEGQLRKISAEVLHWTPILNKLKTQGRFIEVRDPEYMKNIIVLLICHYSQYNGEVWCLRVIKNQKIQYEEEREDQKREDDNNNEAFPVYDKGSYKGCKYDYYSYSIEDIVDIYEEYIFIKIQVTDDEGYQYLGKGDLITSIQKLSELNANAIQCQKPPTIKYEKLAYLDDNILDLLSKKKELNEKIQTSKCYNCLLLKKHLTTYKQLKTLQSELDKKVKKINPENMFHYNEFTLRLRILQKFNYIDENQLITIKGKAAIEIATTDCLLVSEVLLSNILQRLPDEEIIAFLSCFASNKHELNYKDPKISESFTVAFNKFDDIFNNIIIIEQKENGFEDSKYNRRVSFDASHAMNSWMQGVPFYEIVNETDLEEGKLYNLITRIYLFIEEIINFYKTLEYTTLISKFKELQKQLIRDILSIPSLYLQESINIDIT